jgi:hypothetical protein
LSHATTGKIAAQTANALAERMQDHSGVREEFQKAQGEPEFYADGVFVHIRNEDDKAEWCEAQVGALVKRECGESTPPVERDTRDFPEPTVVSAFAAIESKDDFQSRCRRERRRVGVGGVQSTLGDGAKWIGSLVLLLFGKTMDLPCGPAHFGLREGSLWSGTGGDGVVGADALGVVIGRVSGHEA